MFLLLKFSHNITWRDMQYLIARSSNWNNVDSAVKRVENGRKYTGTIYKVKYFDTNRICLKEKRR